MMIKNLISVVIPVYNAEKYIEKNIEAIMRQSYENFEVWLINDGSKDNSLDLCNNLSQKYDNVFTLDKENGGPSSARNLGIDNARGEYLVFVDSDDYVEPDYLTLLYQTITSSQADLAVCGYYKESASGKSDIYSYEKDFVWDYEQAMCYMFENNNFGGYPWNKIFKMKIIKQNGLQFNPTLLKSEDMLFVCQYLQKCKNIAYTCKPLYHYMYNEFSLCRSAKKTNVFDNKDISNIEAHKLIENVIKNNSEKVKSSFRCRLVCTHMRLIVNMFYCTDRNMVISKKSAKIIRNNLIVFLKSSTYGVLEKGGATMMAFSPSIFWAMYRVLNSAFGITIA